MDPGSGRLYSGAEYAALEEDKRRALVHMTGPEASVRTIARHVERGTRKDRRKVARKAQRLARRRNR